MSMVLRFRNLSCAALVAAGLVVSGCTPESAMSKRGSQPLSAKAQAELSAKDMTPSQPILVRIYKQESELEVWKKRTDGKYALFKTYPICRWSGELGPKVREGDRQAPEGFYQVSMGQMNPNSSYYLAFNIGFPNAYDASYGRNGGNVMVHGDCSSRGCYAMTDEQVAEVYTLAREALTSGQKSFQVQAYPFRMTPKNFARHRDNPNLAFWKMLKEGHDHFEVTRNEPKVDVCERRYVFNADKAEGSFSPSATCPKYQIDATLASAVQERRQTDESQIASYVAQSIPTLPAKTGQDGGMHPVFLAKFRPATTTGNDGEIITASASSLPGTIPAHARPPAEAVIPQPASTPAVVALTRTEAPKAKPSPAPDVSSIGKTPVKTDPRPQTVAGTTPSSTPPAAEDKKSSPSLLNTLFTAKTTNLFSLARSKDEDGEKKQAMAAPLALSAETTPAASTPKPASSGLRGAVSGER